MLAIGLESGQVSVYSWQCGNSDQMCWHKLLDFNSRFDSNSHVIDFYLTIIVRPFTLLSGYAIHETA